MNINGLKKDEVENKNLITLKTYSDIITWKMLEEQQSNNLNYNYANNHISNNLNNNTNNYVNNYVNVNEINFINLNDLLFIELSNIQDFMVNIEKINTINSCIYSVSFNHNLLINLNINSSVRQFRHDYFVSHSFTYDSEGTIDIYPISANVSILNNNIHFYITYAFVDSSDDYNEHNNSNNYIKDKLSNNGKIISSGDEYMDFSNFNYIDISKEFV